jgi:hypothetical protein
MGLGKHMKRQQHTEMVMAMIFHCTGPTQKLQLQLVWSLLCSWLLLDLWLRVVLGEMSMNLAGLLTSLTFAGSMKILVASQRRIANNLKSNISELRIRATRGMEWCMARGKCVLTVSHIFAVVTGRTLWIG